MVVLSGEMRGREVEVVQDRITIGRSRQCDLQLPDVSVSRVHVEIRREGESYKVQDMESTSGTYLGGSRISAAFLAPGDELRLGQVEFRFVPRERKLDLLPSEASSFGGVLGQSLAMRKVFAVLERIADTQVGLLLVGETGTGKDLVARAVHEVSGRPGSLIVVDCGALTADHAELELFGRGADDDPDLRRGALELAEGGTLVLDEPESLPLEIQPRLLRALETRRFRRAGASTELALDVRVIATNPRELRACVEDGSIREELSFHLGVVSCELPPLRDRREDIPVLIEVFSRRLPPGMWRPPGPEAMARLVGYEWPGNVRELRNVVERSAYLSPDGGIDLSGSSQAGGGVEASHVDATHFDPTLTFREQK